MVFAVRLKPLYCTNTTTPATAQDLAPLLDRKGEGEGGTLDASPAIRRIDNEEIGMLPRELCARVVTRHAAGLLQACGVERLVLSSNPCLETLPLQALCDVASLTELMCTGCPSLFAPPMEVAEQGGNETMKFLRDCSQDGVFNESLGLFLIGDGEAGKPAFALNPETEVRMREDSKSTRKGTSSSWWTVPCTFTSGERMPTSSKSAKLLCGG